MSKYSDKANADAVTYDEAWRVIEHDYWDDIRGICADIEGRAKSGEIEEDSVYDEIHESCAESARVIYTHQARIGLCCTDNPDAYSEEIGDPAPTVEAQMCMAMIADVTKGLDIDWTAIAEALEAKEAETE